MREYLDALEISQEDLDIVIDTTVMGLMEAETLLCSHLRLLEVAKWIGELQGFIRMRKTSGWQTWNADTISMSGIVRRWLLPFGES
jgi:hypothetical protein